MTRRFLRGLALVALTALPAAAGPLEDGLEAYKKQDYKTAAQDFTLAASQGDANARAYLGTMFAYGIGEPQDGAQALFWLGLAAASNNALADTTLGQLYEQGHFVKQDWPTAFQLLQRAAEQGVPIAQAETGKIYMEGLQAKGAKPDYDKAMQYLLSAAQQNQPDAQYYIGFMYYTGVGQKQDYDAAAHWFLLAGNQNYAPAANMLGVQYDKGMGVPQDDTLALKYFRMSASLGNLEGLGLLGEEYYEGRGVKQDYQRAYLLLSISASQIGSIFHDSVVKQRDGAHGRLTAEQLNAAQSLADFCGTSHIFAVCIYDAEPVTDEAAHPQQIMDKLRQMVAAATPAQPNAPQQTARADPAPSDGKPKLIGTGTGFYVSADGDIVTAAHVVSECSEMRSPNLHLKLVVADTVSDVAVLSSDAKPATFVKLRGGRGAHPGEQVTVVGFPLQGVLGEDAVITNGIVSSLAGLQSDRRDIQISAPIQPGNSGGPVIGADGALLGVAVSSIGTLKAAEAIGGMMPQNVNFAVSVETLQSLLNAHQIAYVLADGQGLKKTSTQIASEAERYTMLLECWK